MGKKVSFHTKYTDRKLVNLIIDRWALMALKYSAPFDAQSRSMDIIACHANGCPLDLERLLATDDFNFTHDVCGIRDHIDRDTGKLLNHFLPRCARKEGH